MTRGPEMAKRFSRFQYIGPGGIEYVNPADDPRKTR